MEPGNGKSAGRENWEGEAYGVRKLVKEGLGEAEDCEGEARGKTSLRAGAYSSAVAKLFENKLFLNL